MAEFRQVVSAHVRLARREDMPHVLALIQQLAEFERLTEMCVATVAKLEATLFKQEPLQGPTVLLLELSSSGEHPHASAEDPSHNSVSADIPLKNFLSDIHNPHGTAHNIILKSPIKDSHALAFKSAEDRTIAGFVLFFPNYSTFLAKPGFYIEDLYVRECYRGHGFGTILLKSVARLAVALDYGRVEWCVLDWNMNAIKFYEGIGAKLLPEWRICRLTGEALDICGS
ncbi:hypothetical protein GOP47_0026456 [Adiantum capillus-veneris]|nr:hypothetical protein GOP47_0026456 [Adiantum capillus-veneris]